MRPVFAPALLLVATLAFASGGAIQRTSVSTTGGTVAGGPFVLNFTVGQSAAHEHLNGSSRLTSGFWCAPPRRGAALRRSKT